ncbi:MAG: SLC45 family MFS transporter [Chloroflexi bacterium]|nr:SLC45 family MFS transporter [Chloroflexota bacterium]
MRWLGLNAYWFGVSFMWGAVHSFMLPQIVSALGGAARNTRYGLLTFAGLVVAMLMTPISGALSDRTRGRWGRRRPWMVLGAFLSGGSLLLLASAKSYLAVAAAYLALQFCSNLAHGAGQGLIPDCVPENERGIASGAKSFLDMLAVVAVAVAISRVLAGDSGRYGQAAAIVAGVLLASLILTLIVARERPLPQGDGARAAGFLAVLRAVYAMDLRLHGDYGRLLVCRFLVLLAIYLVQAFAYYFVADALAVGDAATEVGHLMAIIGVSVMLASLPAGYLSERWGRRTLSLASCGALALGMAVMSQARDVTSIGILGALIGAAMGVFNAVNWAWATDLVPADQAGRYLGLSNLATAGSGATARLFGPVIDLANGWLPQFGYTLMFVVAAGSALAALIVTRRLVEPRGCEQGPASGGGL